MTSPWHIKNFYIDYERGVISWDELVAITEVGVADWEQRPSPCART